MCAPESLFVRTTTMNFKKCLLALLLCLQINASELTDKFPNPTLKELYEYYDSLPVKLSDIGEHMHLLKQLASELPHVTEIGLGWVISTWELLQGLAENPSIQRTTSALTLSIPMQKTST